MMSSSVVVTTPVIVDGAATLLVLQELLGGHADLLGDTDDDRAGHILCVLWEASFQLEALHVSSVDEGHPHGYTLIA